MNPRLLLRIAASAVAVALIGIASKSGRPAGAAAVPAETPAIAKAPVPAAPPSIPAPAGLRAASAPHVDLEFTPGHFPGISVRHEPGTHRPTPPAGTPRSQPVEQEVVLPDGRRLKALTLDESWRVPVTAEEDP